MPDDPQFLWKSETKDTINSFQKVFFLKNFSWTNILQFRQLHPFFCRMLESFDPKLQPVVVKSWDFYQKKFFSPKDSVGLVKAGSTTLLKPFCQKVESIFFKVRECYDIVNIWKNKSKNISGNVECSFDNPFLKFLLKLRELKLKVQKWQKILWKNLLSLRRFYWLRKHKKLQPCRKFFAKFRESFFVKTRKSIKDMFLEQIFLKINLWTCIM